MSSEYRQSLAEQQNPYRRQVAIWLYTGVGMLLFQIILGGITRLTGSGLSITEWNVVTGALPPLTEEKWLIEFDKYRQTPQYLLLNNDFKLSDFQFIFFWEWLHRFWARLIAVAFLIPFIYFVAKKAISSAMVKPLLILFLLGALQGAVGWIMVASGLTGDAIYVKPVKLAVHFVLALGLISYAFWFALTVSGVRTFADRFTEIVGLWNKTSTDAGSNISEKAPAAKAYGKETVSALSQKSITGDAWKINSVADSKLDVSRQRKTPAGSVMPQYSLPKGFLQLTWTILLFLLFQLLFGALLAGHKAATAAPTWPTINGSWLPAMFVQGNIVEDRIAIHFFHRLIAYILIVLVIIWSFGASRLRFANWFIPMILIFTQAVLGIFAVLSSPSIIPNQWGTFDWLAILHQVTGMTFLLSMVYMLYQIYGRASVQTIR